MNRPSTHWLSFRRHSPLTFILCLVFFFAGNGLSASPVFVPEPKTVFSGTEASPWERVEVLEDPHPEMKPEAFAVGGGHVDPDVIRCFGTTTPPSNRFLLHCAPGFAGKTLPHPILLIHGAGDNANRAWMNPWRQPDPKKLTPAHWGMGQWLSQLGYSVFAVTFAHRQGCNIMQAEQVADAITRIRSLLHRENDPDFQVDIIAHSKGNLAARLYCSNAPQVFPSRPFLTAFRKDVRTWVAVGSPMLGMDSPFRSYGYNLMRVTLPLMAGSGPMGAESLLLYGQWQKFPTESYHGAGNRLWPGQAQCLYNLVRDGGIELTPESYTPADLNLSMQALYFGGKSMFLSSRGIDQAIDLGERFMYRLNTHGLEPSVRVLLLAGDNPIINEEGIPAVMQWIFIMGGLIQQTFSHASDGAVFLANATRTDGVLQRGARLLAEKVFHLNHLELTRSRETIQWIDSWLMKP